MKRKMILLSASLIVMGNIFFWPSSLSFAKDSVLFRTQGLVNPGGNLKAGYVLINETRVYVNGATQITDYKGRVLPATEIKAKKWVYVELEKDAGHNAMRARKIYLLPHYIAPTERKQYAFMK